MILQKLVLKKGRNVNSFEILFYEKENGSVPVQEFLLSLNIKMRAKMVRTIELLETYGNDLREPYSKYLEYGIFELRSKIGSDISRVFYFFMVGQQIVITHGYIKKSRKTPKEEIERARKYREDYLRRSAKDDGQV